MMSKAMPASDELMWVPPLLMKASSVHPSLGLSGFVLAFLCLYPAPISCVSVSIPVTIILPSRDENLVHCRGKLAKHASPTTQLLSFLSVGSCEGRSGVNICFSAHAVF